MCHQLFCNEKLRIIGKFDIIFPLCGIYTFNLGCFKGKYRIFSDIDLCHRVENLFSTSVSFRVMVFHIFYISILSHVESVDSVVTGLTAAFPVDPASGNDGHVCSVLYIEIIIYNVNAFLRHDNRDMDLLVSSPLR